MGGLFTCFKGWTLGASVCWHIEERMKIGPTQDMWGQNDLKKKKKKGFQLIFRTIVYFRIVINQQDE